MVMACRFFTQSDRKRETDEGIMIGTASFEAFLIFLGALAGAVAYCVTIPCAPAKALYFAPYGYISMPLLTVWESFISEHLNNFWTLLQLVIVIFSASLSTTENKLI